MWRRLKSLASPLFTQLLFQTQIEENIKVPRHWPLCWEFTDDRWIPRTKGQWRGKYFHLMTSSFWNNDDPVYWRIYASPGGDELKCNCTLMSWTPITYILATITTDNKASDAINHRCFIMITLLFILYNLSFIHHCPIDTHKHTIRKSEEDKHVNAIFRFMCNAK